MKLESIKSQISLSAYELSPNMYMYEQYTSWEKFNPFSNKPWFLRDCSTSLSQTLGKGETACNKQFLLFPQCFLPFEELYAIFIKFKIVICKLFQFGWVQNLSFGKGLNNLLLTNIKVTKVKHWLQIIKHQFK